MRKIIPSLFIIFVLFVSGCELITIGKDIEGNPVEPLYAGEKVLEWERVLEGKLSLINPQVNINNVYVTNDGSRALISSKERVVLFDQGGKLLWEKRFDHHLVEGIINSTGDILAVGDNTGRICVFNEKQELIWETFLDLELENLQITDDGSYLMAAARDPAQQEKGTICLLDGQGNLLWQKEIPGRLTVKMSLQGENVLVLAKHEEQTKLYFFNQKGELLWEKESFYTADVASDGEYVAAVSSSEMIYLFNKKGEKIWSYDPGIHVTQVKISQNGEYLLAYNHFGGADNNLFYLNIKGKLLWQRRIRDDSILSLSAGGERIVVASCRHYSEDFTLINLYDSGGRLRKEIEVGSRVEKAALSQNGEYLVLGCDDGNVYILNLNREIMGEYTPFEEEIVYYIPASSDLQEDYTSINLYFYDENAMVLVPASRSIRKTKELLRASIEELVKGPKVKSYLVRTIPKGMDIRVSIKRGTVFIDLPPDLEGLGGSVQNTGIIHSLLYTVTQFPTVERVRFLIGGEERDVFGDPGIYIGEDFTTDDIKKGIPLLYIPYRSGFRYYLVPWEIQPWSEQEDTGLYLTRKYFQEAANFIPFGVEIRKLEIEGDVIILDLSSEFLKLLERPEDPQLKARAQVIIDGLTVTLTHNLKQNKLQILVEGEKLSYVKGFNLSEPLSRPLNINSEE